MLTTSQKSAVYKNIGRILRDVRESLDLTVEEAAAKQNVSQKTINAYENGSPVRLGAKTVGSLIRFLGNYNALLNIDIEPFTPEPVYTFTGKELAELIREQSRQAAATSAVPETEQ
ncbi:MAG: helix-turn-helix domain-containing protein [Proteobacteria bacterium]|nr:helix-turn-helix domain-containing protein [Pseudomonadota bacterium]